MWPYTIKIAEYTFLRHATNGSSCPRLFSKKFLRGVPAARDWMRMYFEDVATACGVVRRMRSAPEESVGMYLPAAMLLLNSSSMAFPRFVKSASPLRSNSSKIDSFIGDRIFHITAIDGSKLSLNCVKNCSKRFQSFVYSASVSSKTVLTMTVGPWPSGIIDMNSSRMIGSMSFLTVKRSTCPTEPALNAFSYFNRSSIGMGCWNPGMLIVGSCFCRYAIVS
mmetsp:Transcript_64286/g.150996  ORF Transcript_64286/g.150996 Transcript_64286/m.150996 type:complete len:222 (+) Transcript_64286:1468-2133(+)